jgi:purine-nucleoside phosphorylase
MAASPALLLAAFPPELAGLDQRPPAGWRVACTGIGALAAAVATARLLAAGTPPRVLFVGTCGAYDQRLGVGDRLAASEALAVSLDLLEHRAYAPAGEVRRWPATLGPELVLPFPAHPVAVPPAITRTRAGAARLAALAPVEHLELTGVFAACQAAGVPCGAALAVANRVGPEAHGEWRANHERVSRDLLDALAGAGVFG